MMYPMDRFLLCPLGGSPLLIAPAASAEDLAQVLDVGQVLQGKVIAELGNGKWVVCFRGVNLVAASETPLPKDAPITVEVTDLSSGIAMRLLPPESAEVPAGETRMDHAARLLTSLKLAPEPQNIEIALQLRRFGAPVTKSAVETVAAFVSRPALPGPDVAVEPQGPLSVPAKPLLPEGSDTSAPAPGVSQATLALKAETEAEIEAAASLIGRGLPVTRGAVAAARMQFSGSPPMGECIQATRAALAEIANLLPDAAQQEALSLVKALDRLPIRMGGAARGADVAQGLLQFVRNVGLTMESEMLKASPAVLKESPAMAAASSGLGPASAEPSAPAIPQGMPAEIAPEGGEALRGQEQLALEEEPKGASQEPAGESGVEDRDGLTPAGRLPRRAGHADEARGCLKARLLRVCSELRSELGRVGENAPQADGLKEALHQAAGLLNHIQGQQIETVRGQDGVSRLVCQIVFYVGDVLSTAEIRIGAEDQGERGVLGGRGRSFKATVSLDLTSLGRVVARSCLDRGGIACDLALENRSACDLLASHLPELHSALSGLGHTVRRLDCAVGRTVLGPAEKGIPPPMEEIGNLNLVI